MSELPPGFVLDQASSAPSLPQGFVLDQPGVMEDAAKSIGAGLGSAAIGTLGMVGDLTDLGAKGIQGASNYVSDKLGIERYQPSGKSILDNIPTSRSIRATVTDPIVDPDYKPQSAPTEFLKKAAEFAPNLAFGGGVRGAIQNVVAPAIGSVVGENVGGPLGGLVGALVGGAGAGAAAERFKAMAAARTAAKAMPSAEDILTSGSNKFDQARNMDIINSPSFAQKTAADMRAALKDFDPLDASQRDVFRKVDMVEGLGHPRAPEITAQQRLELEMNGLPVPGTPAPQPFAMNELENIRKQLSKLKMSPDGATREAARTAQEALTKNQMALTAADVVSGDGAKYAKTIKDAVGDYAAGKNLQTLAGKMNLAELNLNSPVGGLDMASHGQALQRTMKQLARPINNTNVPIARKLGFKADEVAAITQAANGNKLTHLGDIANQVIPHWMGGGAAASVLRAMGGLSVKRQVSALSSLVASRSPLAAHVASQLPPAIVQQLPAKSQRLLQALVLAEPTLAQQSGQPVSQGNSY